MREGNFERREERRRGKERNKARVKKEKMRKKTKSIEIEGYFVNRRE
jgi:hypothetical protein